MKAPGISTADENPSTEKKNQIKGRYNKWKANKENTEICK